MPTSPAPLGARWRFSPALAEFEAYLEQGRPRHVNEPANLCGHTHTAGADSCATTGETDFYETPTQKPSVLVTAESDAHVASSQRTIIELPLRYSW